MHKIPLDCGQINDAGPRPTEIVIYGPKWREEHPYSDALVKDLHKFNWRTWVDGLGRFCAAPKSLLPIGGEA